MCVCERHSHHEGGHYGESEDATQAWYGKQIMFDKPNSYNVKYKVTFAAATTVYGLTGQYDAGATLKWRKHGDTTFAHSVALHTYVYLYRNVHPFENRPDVIVD